MARGDGSRGITAGLGVAKAAARRLGQRTDGRMTAKWGTVSLVMLISGSPAQAYDVNESLSVGLVLAGAMQCQRPSGGGAADDECRGAAPVQPELSFRPSQDDELFFKLGFAAGNALNETSPFLLAPWAAYLKDNVKNLNGRNRDHLLVARYKQARNSPAILSRSKTCLHLRLHRRREISHLKQIRHPRKSRANNRPLSRNPHRWQKRSTFPFPVAWWVFVTR